MYMYYIEELSIFVWSHDNLNYVFFLARKPSVYMSNTISDGFSIKLTTELEKRRRKAAEDNA